MHQRQAECLTGRYKAYLTDDYQKEKVFTWILSKTARKLHTWSRFQSKSTAVVVHTLLQSFSVLFASNLSQAVQYVAILHVQFVTDTFCFSPTAQFMHSTMTHRQTRTTSRDLDTPKVKTIGLPHLKMNELLCYLFALCFAPTFVHFFQQFQCPHVESFRTVVLSTCSCEPWIVNIFKYWRISHFEKQTVSLWSPDVGKLESRHV